MVTDRTMRKWRKGSGSPPGGRWIERLEARELLSTYLVTTLADGPGRVWSAGRDQFNASTLRAAITAANATRAADRIVFAGGVTGSVGLLGPLPELTRSLSITGPGLTRMTLERSRQPDTPGFSLLRIPPGATVSISGLSFRNGTGEWRDGMLVGGAIDNSGRLSLSRCDFSGNSDTYSGVGIEAGGGIYNDGTLKLGNCRFDQNAAEVGAAVFSIGELHAADCVFTGNIADSLGGFAAIFNGGTARFDRCAIADTAGGGLDNHGVAVVNRCAIRDNALAGHGGGISNLGTLTVLDSRVSGNMANTAAGIYNGGHATITRTTLDLNASCEAGAGIFNDGWLTMTGSTVSQNSVALEGGGAGLFNNGGAKAVVVACTFADNFTISGHGGAIENFGKLALNNSTLYHNDADAGGGLDNDGLAVLTHCTIAENLSLRGGGIFNNDAEGASMTCFNTIVAQNHRREIAADSDIVGRIDPLSSHNLIGVGGAGGLLVGRNGNQVGVRASVLRLGTLKSNGGPTPTVALLSGSIAIDAGETSAAALAGLTSDQRGFRRCRGKRVDIGSVEM